MNFNEYQEQAHVTSRYHRNSGAIRENVLMAALGLSGEVGELNDRIKKVFYHQHELDRVEIEKELGDILWYLAEMCSAFNFELGIIAENNLYKLRNRYPNGFSAERSINRSE